MNRELTKREKALLLVLVVMVLALGYFKLILEPINDQITSLRFAAETEQAQLDTDLAKMAQMEQMRKVIADMKASGQMRSLPKYDNDEVLMEELHELMAATLEYSLDCTAGTTQEDYIVLRPVVITYRTASYAQARQIIDKLSSSLNINHLSNVSINWDKQKNTYETTLAITYFEIIT